METTQPGGYTISVKTVGNPENTISSDTVTASLTVLSNQSYGDGGNVTLNGDILEYTGGEILGGMDLFFIGNGSQHYVEVPSSELKDYKAVEELTREAFGKVYKPGADEHYYVHMMRNHPDFIPKLAFVPEKDVQIIGNIMYTQA